MLTVLEVILLVALIASWVIPACVALFDYFHTRDLFHDVDTVLGELVTSKQESEPLESASLRLSKLVHDLRLLADARDLIRMKHEFSIAQRCFRCVRLLCFCNRLTAWEQREAVVIEKEDQLLDHVADLTRSADFHDPNIREQLETGVLDVKDDSLKDWLLEMSNSTRVANVKQQDLPPKRPSVVATSKEQAKFVLHTMRTHVKPASRQTQVDLSPRGKAHSRLRKRDLHSPKRRIQSSRNRVRSESPSRRRFSAELDSPGQKSAASSFTFKTRSARAKTLRLKVGSFDDSREDSLESILSRNSVTDTFTRHNSLLVSLGSQIDGENEVDIVEAVKTWDFDIFAVHTAAPQLLLPYVGFAILTAHDLISKLSLDMQVVEKALGVIAAGYHADNPFHNAIHAADVAHSVSCLIRDTELHRLLPDHEIFALLIAALCHDYDHPGVTNAFLITTSHPLAQLYNDQSVLENHHAAASLTKLFAKPSSNVLLALPEDMRKATRGMIINLILATDLGQNFSIVDAFKRRFLSSERRKLADAMHEHQRSSGLQNLLSMRGSKRATAKVIPSPSGEFKTSSLRGKQQKRRMSLSGMERQRPSSNKPLLLSVTPPTRAVTVDTSNHANAPHLNQPVLDEDGPPPKRQQSSGWWFHISEKDVQKVEDRLLLCKMIIKCADLGHPAQMWKLHMEWTERVSKEFYQQGQQEVEQGLPVSPLCDESKHHQLPKQQMGFFDFLVLPMWQALLPLFPNDALREARTHLQHNRLQWQLKHEGLPTES